MPPAGTSCDERKGEGLPLHVLPGPKRTKWYVFLAHGQLSWHRPGRPFYKSQVKSENFEKKGEGLPLHKSCHVLKGQNGMFSFPGTDQDDLSRRKPGQVSVKKGWAAGWSGSCVC